MFRLGEKTYEIINFTKFFSSFTGMGIMIECFNVYMALVMLIFRVHYTIGISLFYK